MLPVLLVPTPDPGHGNIVAVLGPNWPVDLQIDAQTRRDQITGWVRPMVVDGQNSSARLAGNYWLEFRVAAGLAPTVSEIRIDGCRGPAFGMTSVPLPGQPVALTYDGDLQTLAIELRNGAQRLAADALLPAGWQLILRVTRIPST
jgi:hypothetical protein